MVRWVLDDDFVATVHAALKRLHRREALGQHPLAFSSVVTLTCRQKGWPLTTLGRAAALQEVLTQALTRLATVELEAATLLKQRFWQGKSVRHLVGIYHFAESTLYARQERAIRRLSDLLWSMERSAQETLEQRRHHRLRHLPAPTYTRLFGFDALLARLRNLLTAPEGPFVLSLEGLGGLGKTALAHRLAVWAAEEAYFADIAWISARRYAFLTWDRQMAMTDSFPALTFERLLETVAEQLFPDLQQETPPRQESELRALLRKRPYLIVVDNLETAIDHRQLIPRLWELANPSRFILTGRYSLAQYAGLSCFTLGELNEADSLALMRHEARRMGAVSLADADVALLRQVYAATGGNPLAIKLVIGQARTLPLKRVLNRLKKAIGRRYEDLYRFVYRQSWEMLSDDARLVLLAMPALAPSGAYWENLKVATALPDWRLDRAIEQLVGMSLLQASGRDEVRYTIHQLTYTFVLSELLGRWEDGNRNG